MELTIETLLACYRQGVFPMAEARDDPEVFLVDPRLRGLLPLERFHAPRRLLRALRSTPEWELRVNTAFDAVVEGCAAPRPGAANTWINPQIQSLYGAAHRLGHAHSVECWRGQALAGGLYGVALGGAFFGESMFQRERDASKAALLALVRLLRGAGFALLDAQFWTPHLAQFGAVQVPRGEFQRMLRRALALPVTFPAAAAPLRAPQLAQEITQMS